MTDDQELIARLREGATWDDDVAAADRIEALIKERDEAVHLARLRKTFIEEARDERDALEAKLAKAVEALDMLVRDCEADYPPSHVAIKYFAIGALAEIKGESYE
jgi:hypothetical protein